eukprot:scaffold2193_cov74-Phaeocystis_antarctica.AAC.5
MAAPHSIPWGKRHSLARQHGTGTEKLRHVKFGKVTRKCLQGHRLVLRLLGHANGDCKEKPVACVYRGAVRCEPAPVA